MRVSFFFVLASLGCSSLPLDPAPAIIHARFDPQARVIPMPNDALRDEDAKKLEIAVDDEEMFEAPLHPAEHDLFDYLNTFDGWSSAMPATLEFTAPIDPESVNADTLEVWDWRQESPLRVLDARVHVETSGTKITIDAPRTGWQPGHRYVIVARGLEGGIRGANGEEVECDAAFYFLRMKERLDHPGHERAFPGKTRAERRDNAKKLEELRLDLRPYFEWLESREIPRTRVAALWTFTVTESPELAMDKASQRMPLPFDILVDVNTGQIDIPPADWDYPFELDAKHRLSEFDGFGLSSDLMFEFTREMDASTLNASTVRLYALDDPRTPLPVAIRLLADQKHVVVEPASLPLREATTYVVVIHQGIRDLEGREARAMPLGHLMLSDPPLVENGRSVIRNIDLQDAERIEHARDKIRGFLEAIGTGDVVTAWPFTTMHVTEPLLREMNSSERLGLDAHPHAIETMSALDAVRDFALSIGSILNVDRVITGTISSPDYLDVTTRARRSDGSYEVRNIPFTMTIPKSANEGEPLRVVIFGHGLMTERRFVLSVGDALAQRGFAAISIDFPYHGTRTHCVSQGPLSIPNPIDGELSELFPCEPGYTCIDDGRCVDDAGEGNHLSYWPVVTMPTSSGGAFIDVDHVPATRDHFVQALIDLTSLKRALLRGDWRTAIGNPIDTQRLYYAGQSLGGIIGATFVALTPEIERAVLNVPGADVVDLFDDSTYFGPHVDAFFKREEIESGSPDDVQFMNVARWIMDAADPQSFAWMYSAQNRQALIQMALLDAIVPNSATETLERLSGLPRRDYLAEHAFLTIPIEPAYLRGTQEMAAFLAGDLAP